MGMKQYANSGVDGISGYEFQKHCALYIFLEQYQEIKDKKYFICLEHYEDFLFCFIDENQIIEKIATYQAKKSSQDWTLTQDFIEIIKKILEVGQDIMKDTAVKADTYRHNLHFLSNHNIILKKKKVSNIINERNAIVEFNNLYQEIKDEIKSLINSLEHTELDNLSFKWIDIGKTCKKQEQLLVGMFCEIFGMSVADHKASVYTLLSLFRNVENTLNQGNIIALMNNQKRVNSEQINKALNVITTKQKIFDEWRSKKDIYAPILKIPTIEQKKFSIQFENAFDYIKDLTQVEHQRINNFVKMIDISDCYSDEESLKKIVSEFTKKYNTQFDDITIKASILASYIQLKEGIV